MHSLNGKTILVTGGTGFIGKALCLSMMEQGARVIILTRSSIRTHDRFIYVSDLALLNEPVDTIINLAGEPVAQRWTEAAKQRIRMSRLGVTAAIIKFIASAQHKPELLISASAIGYYGTDESTEFDENSSPMREGSFSSDLCASWEDVACQAEGYGIRTVLLRIGAVLGKDGGMLARLMPLFYLGAGGPIGHGRQWLSWIDRDDLIKLINHIISTKTISGAINATSPAPVRNLEFARILAKIMHRPSFLRAPARMLRLVFGRMADEIMLEGQYVFPKKAIESGFKFSYPQLELSLKHIFRQEHSQ